MCGREGKSLVLAVKRKKNVFLQAGGLGSKTSKGGFTKHKVREMTPSVRRVAGQGCGLSCIATASFSHEHFDINLVFLMLHLSVRSWFTVGIPFNLKTPGTLGFYCLFLLCDTLDILSNWGICSEH